MSTSIKAVCPKCGEMELTPSDLRLVICERVPEKSYYAFDCVGCIEQVKKPADERIIALLRSGGVAAERWTIPLEALEEKKGNTINKDDILDFAMNLYSDNFLLDQFKEV